MGGGKLAEKVALAASLLAAGCVSDHHVSPWGEERPSQLLQAYLRPPDRGAQLAVVDAETASLHLAKTAETSFAIGPKGSARTAVLRGYEGRDAGGRRVHAVRVATDFGVVLALGPLDAGDLDRSLATELVPALVGGGAPSDGASGVAFASGTDLNGDGSPDVVVKNEAGALAMWHVGELGSAEYAIAMATPPSRGADVDGDGKIDLLGQVPIEEGDPIAPKLVDVATFDGSRYADTTPAARAWHAREADARRARKGDGDAERLRTAIERAWHAILAGGARDTILAELGREPVPRALASSFEAYRRRLASLPSR